jgi:hypothetical protein
MGLRPLVSSHKIPLTPMGIIRGRIECALIFLRPIASHPRDLGTNQVAPQFEESKALEHGSQPSLTISVFPPSHLADRGRIEVHRSPRYLVLLHPMGTNNNGPRATSSHRPKGVKIERLVTWDTSPREPGLHRPNCSDRT